MKFAYLIFLIAAVFLIDAGYEQYSGRAEIRSRKGMVNVVDKETQPEEFANVMGFKWFRAGGLVVVGFIMISIVRRQERLMFIPHDSDGE